MNVRLKVYVSMNPFTRIINHERKMDMYLGKVTREYAEQEQERIKRQARQQSRLKSAFYSTTKMSHANDDIIDEGIDVNTESEDECEESLLTSP